MNIVHRFFMILVFVAAGCAPALSASETAEPPPAAIVIVSPTPAQPQASTLTSTQPPTLEEDSMSMPVAADVLSVQVTGQPKDYQFQVRVSSADMGCEQYADWWEVLSEDGQLLYRRVLLHSHVGEQPFTRSGGPVAVDENMLVIVRAHMNTGGYGGTALRGTVSGGFEPVQLESGFAAEVEALPPLPDGCGF